MSRKFHVIRQSLCRLKKSTSSSLGSTAMSFFPSPEKIFFAFVLAVDFPTMTTKMSKFVTKYVIFYRFRLRLSQRFKKYLKLLRQYCDLHDSPKRVVGLIYTKQFVSQACRKLVNHDRPLVVSQTLMITRIKNNTLFKNIYFVKISVILTPQPFRRRSSFLGKMT